MLKSSNHTSSLSQLLMKKSELFDVPQRQSHLAVIFIILGVFKTIFKQIWPLFAVFFIGGNSSSGFSKFEMIISGLGIIGIGPAIISYFKFYYHLTDTELVISKGLFKKVRLNIPFERIQSVNFNQSFLHQALKVTEVEIDTAGSDSQETKIDALDMDTAEALRARILQMKGLSAQPTNPSDPSVAQIMHEAKETILTLSTTDLFRVGLVQNHLKPLGVLIGLVFTMYFYTSSFDFDIREVLQNVIEPIADYKEQADYSGILIVLGLLFVSFIITIVSTIIKYYKLEFWRSGAKFQVVHGLFTRREYAALDNKVQILKWGQNILERWIGFHNITFAQAKSSDEKKESGTIKIPGCSEAQVQYVQQSWLGEKAMQQMELTQVSPHLFYRTAIYLVLGMSAIALVSYYFGEVSFGSGVLLIMIILVGLQWLHYKKKKFGYNGRELYVGGGTVGLKHALLPVYKIQGLKLSANPYQWRRDLTSLIVYTAGGKIIIPYIKQEKAAELFDELTYQVERSKKPWM